MKVILDIKDGNKPTAYICMEVDLTPQEFDTLHDAFNGVNVEKAIAWLEKQKPVEWTKEDENCYNEVVRCIEQSTQSSAAEHGLLTWLKSLCPQKQCGYNPYKEVVESIAEMCEKYTSPTSNLSDFLDNVKVKCKDAKEYDSLFPLKQWKPSKEQMNALEHFVRSIGESGYISSYDRHKKTIYSLLDDLKKL